MVKLTELPPDPKPMSMACRPKQIQLFLKTTPTPHPDHENCPEDLFTCWCPCHRDGAVDLRDMKIDSITVTLDEGFPGSKIISVEKEK